MEKYVFMTLAILFVTIDRATCGVFRREDENAFREKVGEIDVDPRINQQQWTIQLTGNNTDDISTPLFPGQVDFSEFSGNNSCSTELINLLLGEYSPYGEGGHPSSKKRVRTLLEAAFNNEDIWKQIYEKELQFHIDECRNFLNDFHEMYIEFSKEYATQLKPLFRNLFQNGRTVRDCEIMHMTAFDPTYFDEAIRYMSTRLLSQPLYEYRCVIPVVQSMSHLCLLKSVFQAVDQAYCIMPPDPVKRSISDNI